MRVFVAGATGAVGRPLVRMLAASGHHVTAMTRSEARASALRSGGVDAVVCDVFDPDVLRRTVLEARPDVLIHELTDIPPALDPDPAMAEEQLAGNRRIRTEGTRILVDAAVAAGASRVVAESIAFAYAPVGGPVKVEHDPLMDGPSADAVRALESSCLGTAGIEGAVLRYGYFYGPGSFYAEDGSATALVRRGELPIVGDDDDLTSFVHVDDAAAATLLALESPPGIYNVVDDEPAPTREWLPVFAEAVGAPPPPRTRGDGRAEDYARGASNAKAKRLLGWIPRYASWRDGFSTAPR